MAYRFILILTLLFLNSLSFAQQDFKAILNIKGDSEFNISQDSTIWIASRTGATYYTNHFRQPWKYGNFRDDKGEFNVGQTFERASFFNKNIGYISGYIQEDSRQDFIYWTNDGGKHWEKVRFGQSSWIDANYIDYSGLAWMSGSSPSIFHSSDFGKTWDIFKPIDPRSKLRINTIYFEDHKKGIVGGLWNAIYFTNNNCQSWKKIPTPLDQKKYNKIYKESRPTIIKVQRFNNSMIVNQKGKIFHTQTAHVNWVPLENLTDFHFDKASNKLFGITKEKKVVILNEDFNTIWSSPQALQSFPKSIKALNGTLYTWHWEYMYQVDENRFNHQYLYTDEHPIQKPYHTAKATFMVWGTEGKQIFRSNDFGATWYRVAYLDFNLGNFKVLNDHEVIISDKATDRYFKLSTQGTTYSLTPTTLNNPLDDFLKSPITKVILETGSAGCFHHNISQILYVKQANQKFKTVGKEAGMYELERNDDYLLQSYSHSFNAEDITNILTKINTEQPCYLQIKDLQINEEDIQNYLSEIDWYEKAYQKSKTRHKTLKIFPYKTIDFDFFRDVANNLQSLDSTTINQLFLSPSNMFSTTTNWTQITVINEQGNNLYISNRAYQKNPWMLPWQVHYEGLIFPINLIEVSQFLENNSPNSFVNFKEAKIDFIFKVAHSLYKKKLSEYELE